jgi:hypothetical protein
MHVIDLSVAVKDVFVTSFVLLVDLWRLLNPLDSPGQHNTARHSED